jgi:hypothetical protein
MSWQDIVQMGWQAVIGGGVVFAFSRFFRAQEKTIAAQAEQMKALKTTIDAQAEQMRAQSTVLIDVERNNKIMQQIIDTVDAPAMLERWQKYKGLVDQNAQDEVKRLQAQFEEQSVEQVRQAIQGFLRLVNAMLLFLHPELRNVLIEEAGFPPSIQQQIQQLAALQSYPPITVQVPLTAQFHRHFFRQLLGSTPAPQTPETDRL